VTLGALAWAALGTAASAAVPTTESAQPLLALTFYPLLLLSGALGDVGAPGWLTALLRWLPAEPLIDAARHAVDHASGSSGLGRGRDLAVLAAWAMLGAVVSWRWFTWSPRSC
jgi:ABC-2 type transport system permease protein